MNFNSDPVKQAPEVIFRKKTQKQNHSLLFSNQSAVIQTTFQNGSRLKTWLWKKLGMVLESQHDFAKKHLNKVSKIT